jgi:hypothetical protein
MVRSFGPRPLTATLHPANRQHPSRFFIEALRSGCFVPQVAHRFMQILIAPSLAVFLAVSVTLSCSLALAAPSSSFTLPTALKRGSVMHHSSDHKILLAGPWATWRR